MKQKDLVTIGVIVFVSAVLSFIVSQLFITTPKNRTATVEVVQPITPSFPQPDAKYFNTSSIDPTQLIKIGDNSNSKPFNGQP